MWQLLKANLILHKWLFGLYIFPILGHILVSENLPPRPEKTLFFIGMMFSKSAFFNIYFPIVVIQILFIQGHKHQKHLFQARLPISNMKQAGARLLFWLSHGLLITIIPMIFGFLYSKFISPPFSMDDFTLSAATVLVNQLFNVSYFLFLITLCHIAYDLVHGEVIQCRVLNKKIYYVLGAGFYFLAHLFLVKVQENFHNLQSTLPIIALVIIAIYFYIFQKRQSYIY